ncbi:MAG: DUF72 domain-containing protein [Chitinophagaceae bacterium]
MKDKENDFGKKGVRKQSQGVLRVGTSGIVTPGNKQAFPPEFQNKSRLCYYGSLFNTLELNSTFYKTPMPSTFEKWAREVPDNFRFTVKLSKNITHVKKLTLDFQAIRDFLNAAANLGVHKGCLLVQFPASITADFILEVEEILGTMQKLDTDDAWHKSVEFRHVSWYTHTTQELLGRYGASMVLQDMPRSNNLEAAVDEPWFYFRFHGPKGDYKGSYSETFLKEQSHNIQHLLQGGKDVYAYFNNTMGDAFTNATKLRRLVAGDAGP